MTPELLDAAIAQFSADEIAGIMLTNPSTLGTFETNIAYVSKRLKEIGALLYYDGANLNALVGVARPGDMGFDLMHYNTHKTFSTPHGGGGPGSGPIGVKAHLAPYLPHPQVRKAGDGYEFFTPERSIGRMKMWHGQWGMILRCWAYILLHGPDGLRENTEAAILTPITCRRTSTPGAIRRVEPDGSPRYCMPVRRQRGAIKCTACGHLAKALLNRGRRPDDTSADCR
jgi:glycine dehydrogenase subunit 2